MLLYLHEQISWLDSSILRPGQMLITYQGSDRIPSLNIIVCVIAEYPCVFGIFPSKWIPCQYA